MTRNFRTLSCIAALVAAVACGASSPDPAPGDAPAGSRTSTLAFQEVAGPEIASGAQPRLFAGRERLLLSWLEPTDDETHALRYSALGESGTWSAPRTVIAEEALLANWADFPSLTELQDGTLAAHWLRRSAAEPWYAYDVWISLLPSGASDWTTPVKLHDDDVAGEHGFVSVVPSPGGGFHAIWLDGRATTSPGTGESEGDERGAMTLRAAHVAADGTISERDLLDERICDCCQTDATRVGDRVVAVYRDRSRDEIRDIYAVARDDDGWSDPVRVAEDGWRIPGCPVNGPAIDARGDLAAVAWFTLIDQQPQVRLAFSRDGARSFDAPIVVEGVGEGAVPLGRVDTVWVGSLLVTVWLSDVEGVAEIRYAAFDTAGTEVDRGSLGTTSAARASGFPRMAARDDEAWIVWHVPADPRPLRLQSLRAVESDS